MPRFLPPRAPFRSVRHFLPAALTAACLLCVTAAAGPWARQETFPLRARSEVAAGDSLHYEVKAGEVLIIALPAKDDNGPTPRYSILRAPALSWLYQRSFFWRTLPADAGEHVILFSVGFEDGSPDTLAVRVFVR